MNRIKIFIKTYLLGSLAVILPGAAQQIWFIYFQTKIEDNKQAPANFTLREKLA